VDEQHGPWIRTVHHENVVWSIPPFTVHVDFSKPEPSGKVCITLPYISTSLHILPHIYTIYSFEYEASHRVLSHRAPRSPSIACCPSRHRPCSCTAPSRAGTRRRPCQYIAAELIRVSAVSSYPRNLVSLSPRLHVSSANASMSQQCSSGLGQSKNGGEGRVSTNESAPPS
jgi:hypothetical protein